MANFVIKRFEGSFATSVAMGGVTFNFSAPVACGLDQTGRAYVVDNGNVTVTSVTPAQSVDGSARVVNGLQKNPDVLGDQAIGEGYRGWDAALNETGSVSLSGGDKLLKSNWSSYGSRSGDFTEFACLHCVNAAPSGTEVLGPTYTWPGDTTPQLYSFDLETFYAERQTYSDDNITWSNFSALHTRLNRFWPTVAKFPQLSAGNVSIADRVGYEQVSPIYFGEPDSGQSGANYGREISASISELMLVTTLAAGSNFTEQQIKNAILTVLMHGIEWGTPLAYCGVARTPPNGGHIQFTPGPSIFALNALGLQSKVADFMADNSGGFGQPFKIDSTKLPLYEPHDSLFQPWFRRRRTLPAQSVANTLTLPLIGLDGSGDGDMQRDAAMPEGSRVVRDPFDGTVATFANKYETPNVTGNTTSDIPLTGANPFSEGGQIVLLPPVAEPIQLGTFDFFTKEFSGGVSPSFDAGYRSTLTWGGQLMALHAHGMADANIEAVTGYFEVAHLSDYPSSTNNYPSPATTNAAQYFTENWQASWSVLTVPHAMTLADWALTGAGLVTLAALPDNGGRFIEAVQYRLNGGAWTDSGLSYPVNGDDFTIPGYAGENVELRCVNALGNADPSDVKAA